MKEIDTIEKSEIFLSIIQSHKGIIYKVTNMYCKNVEDRQDLSQEIIIQLWKSFDNYDDKFKHSTWIYRISLNVAISFYRKENTRRKITNPLIDGIINFPDEVLTEDTETDLKILQQLVSQLK
ncbi:MAG: sigma-70 family RNA polymerase sigma factor, partial [Chitinophagaceae bacterium]|nr:sigma-70 family RNA polymerase sigma factor [Chitinophagaceae bacterium]